MVAALWRGRRRRETEGYPSTVVVVSVVGGCVEVVSVVGVVGSVEGGSVVEDVDVVVLVEVVVVATACVLLKSQFHCTGS